MKNNRLKPWVQVSIILILISFVTRVILLVASFEQIDFSISEILGAFFIGLCFDGVNAIYATLPLVLYLWLIPGRIFQRQWHKYVLLAWIWVYTSIFTFSAAAEILFWDEFNARFNFIAVDYLVYTTEVLGNIVESYPVFWIVTSVGVASTVISVMTFFLSRSQAEDIPFGKRSRFIVIYTLAFAICYFSVASRFHRFSGNAYANEIAANGMYELFAAYLNNELDYDQFYTGIKTSDAFDLVRQMMKTPDASWMNQSGNNIERRIVNVGTERKLHVVLISVESLSADFMGLFGNQRQITPFLDSLAQHSLVFTNLFATGTRTVRGLEALSLCVPPTPGQSIVRRPDNEHLFSLGKVFHDKGYQCKYIYGGYGYFDNMNYFFANNDYEVVDRTAIDEKDIHYENIWGVADEDLFTLAERELDNATPQNPVFAHIMTTSNHRPYTYPDNRIDIPSHTSRDGAVKYADYAIGKFIKHAQRKSWFKNTVFIVVADHCASSAGKTDLPVNKYHIPMLVFSPANIEPAKMDRMMSQIDIGPTVLGMLNFSYTSRFFGYDIFKLEAGKERAFISTYQNLGYLKGKRLVVLSPRHQVMAFELSDNLEPLRVTEDKLLVKEAIAWYQTASYAFKHGLMKPNIRQTYLK